MGMLGEARKVSPDPAGYLRRVEADMCCHSIEGLIHRYRYGGYMESSTAANLLRAYLSQPADADLS
jgi:hypothetical protein